MRQSPISAGPREGGARLRQIGPPGLTPDLARITAFQHFSDSC
jgi:hypothetical protein